MAVSQYPTSSGGGASIAGSYLGTIGLGNSIYGFSSGTYEVTHYDNAPRVMTKAMANSVNYYSNLEDGDFANSSFFISYSGNLSPVGDFSSEVIVSQGTSAQIVQYPTASGVQFPAAIEYDYAISSNPGERKFVSVGNSGSYQTSSNGFQWTDRGYMPTSYKSQYAISYIDGKFVSIGQQGTGCFSSDGQNWTSFSIGDTSQNIYNRPQFLNGQYFIIGSNAVFSSSDLSSWTKVTVQYAHQSTSQIAFGNGMYVLTTGGDYTYTYSSSDGNTWTQISSITQNNSQQSPRGVAFSSSGTLSGFYAVGKTKLWKSADGVTWTSEVLPSGPNIYYKIQIIDDRILVNYSGDSRSIWQSKDGVLWKRLGKIFGNQKGNDVLKDGNTYYLSVNSFWLTRTTELFKAAQPFVVNVFKSNYKDLA